IKGVQGIQSQGGHHVVVYSTTIKQPAGTSRVCTDADMTSFRFSAGAGGEGQGAINMAPANLVFRIPAGSQLVVNHHYINATPKPTDAQSVVNVYFAEPGTQNIPAGSLAFLDSSMRIPAGGGGLDVTCTLNKEFDAWLVIPHMHELGRHITVDH